MEANRVLEMVDRLDALELDAFQECDKWLKGDELTYGQRLLLTTCSKNAAARVSAVFERRRLREEAAKKLKEGV